MASPIPRLPPVTSSTPALIGPHLSRFQPATVRWPTATHLTRRANNIAPRDKYRLRNALACVSYTCSTEQLHEFRIRATPRAAQPAPGSESPAPAACASAAGLGLPHAPLRTGHAIPVRGPQSLHLR